MTHPSLEIRWARVDIENSKSTVQPGWQSCRRRDREHRGSGMDWKFEAQGKGIRDNMNMPVNWTCPLFSIPAFRPIALEAAPAAPASRNETFDGAPCTCFPEQQAHADLARPELVSMSCARGRMQISTHGTCRLCPTWISPDGSIPVVVPLRHIFHLACTRGDGISALFRPIGAHNGTNNLERMPEIRPLRHADGA